MDLGLAGRNVVVTGAGRGMGVEIALAFAREGANLVVHYFSEPFRARVRIQRQKPASWG